MLSSSCQALNVVKLLSRDGSHFKSFLLCVTSFKSRFNMLKTPWVCVYRKHNKLSLIFYWNSPLSFCDDDIWPLPEPEKAKQTLEMKYCKLNVSCSESVFRKFQNGMDCWCMDVIKRGVTILLQILWYSLSVVDDQFFYWFLSYWGR